MQVQSTAILKGIVREYTDAFNRGDLKGVCRVFAEDAQIFGVLGSGGLDVARPIWQTLMNSFGMQLEIVALAAEGNTVAVRYREFGTFRGPFRGVEPTGKSYEITSMEWFEFANGKVAKRWGARDSASISRQLGIPLN